MRERLRTALERNSILEDELLLANQDIKALQDELDRFRRRFKERSRSSVRLSLSLEDRGFSIDQVHICRVGPVGVTRCIYVGLVQWV